MRFVRRVTRWGAGILLLTLAGLKLLGDSEPAALTPLHCVAAFLEGSLGLALVVGWRPRLTASLLGLLGVTFIIWQLAVPATPDSPRGCACLGPVRIAQYQRMLLAGFIACLGGLLLLLSGPLSTKAERGI